MDTHLTISRRKVPVQVFVLISSVSRDGFDGGGRGGIGM